MIGQCAHASPYVAHTAISYVTRLVIGFHPVKGTRDLGFWRAIRRYQYWRR